MLLKVDLSKVLFLDIETVGSSMEFEQLDDDMQALWTRKANQITPSAEPLSHEEVVQTYWDKAGIYAEYGKIVCISVGVIIVDRRKRSIECRIKSFKSDDEKEILTDFSQMVTQYYNDPEIHFFCGHNIKEFDIPYICRRLLINGLPLPIILDIHGRKPWENKFIIDTLQLWKFGDFKHYTSIKLLTKILGVPSPKDDIDGSMVHKVYYEDQDLDRIATYCEKDVLAVVQLLFKFKGKPLLESNQIHFV